MQKLLIKLNSYQISAKDLGLLDIQYSGFVLSDWIDDIKNRLSVLNNKKEKQQLSILENKLTQMLSEEKQVELELDDIEKMIKK